MVAGGHSHAQVWSFRTSPFPNGGGAVSQVFVHSHWLVTALISWSWFRHWHSQLCPEVSKTAPSGQVLDTQFPVPGQRVSSGLSHTHLQVTVSTCCPPPQAFWSTHLMSPEPEVQVTKGSFGLHTHFPPCLIWPGLLHPVPPGLG